MLDHFIDFTSSDAIVEIFTCQGQNLDNKIFKIYFNDAIGTSSMN